jgi:hypothetical protein
MGTDEKDARRGNYVAISGHPSCHSANTAKIRSNVLASFEMRVNDQRKCSSAASATRWVGRYGERAKGCGTCPPQRRLPSTRRVDDRFQGGNGVQSATVVPIKWSVHDRSMVDWFPLLTALDDADSSRFALLRT